MVRSELGHYYNQRRRFEGTFQTFGVRQGWKHAYATLVLINVKDIATGKIVTDHLWFTMGKQFDKMGLKNGDVVRFNARVTKYLKGYKHRDYDDRTVDYRLSFPTSFRKMSQADTHQVQLVEGS